MPKKGDKASKLKSSWTGVQLTLSRIPFDRKTIWGVIFILGIIVIVPIARAAGWENSLLAAGVQAALGVGAALLISPAPNERDLSAQAQVAMQRVLDTYAHVEEARRMLTETSKELGDTGNDYISRQLIGPQNLLLQQGENFARSMADWEEITPGTKDKVIEMQQKGRSTLEELMKEKNFGK
ncbi:hypothetical protein [Glutamicibacter sp. 2E12]|uniref:hypothetical protein n=1 Tax=Glutamicibacter sp. 2E12 TaxID=3416181 RepID=UPI003CF7E485